MKKSEAIEIIKDLKIRMEKLEFALRNVIKAEESKEDLPAACHEMLQTQATDAVQHSVTK